MDKDILAFDRACESMKINYLQYKRQLTFEHEQKAKTQQLINEIKHLRKALEILANRGDSLAIKALATHNGTK